MESVHLTPANYYLCGDSTYSFVYYDIFGWKMSVTFAVM